MDYRKEILELYKYLRKQASKERANAKDATANYTRGLNTGYASAFELCAKWLNEILEEGA